jgi:hypothetical protein
LFIFKKSGRFLPFLRRFPYFFCETARYPLSSDAFFYILKKIVSFLILKKKLIKTGFIYMKLKKILFFLCFLLKNILIAQQDYVETGVCVIGGGASGTAAALQAARMNVKTILVEETPWLGGMLTSAGVSAIDGNDQMPSGFWGEFRDSLYKYYRGKRNLGTGWVSNTLFEPYVGAEIFKNMVDREQHLRVFLESKCIKIKRIPKPTEVHEVGWMITIQDKTGQKWNIHAKQLIDGTELGDVAKMVGAKYRIGTDDPGVTGEEGYAAARTDIVQDMTYVAIIKDYGGDATPMKRPSGYDPKLFYCSCLDNCTEIKGVHGCAKMLDYGKLPGKKYMINWPKYGNDYYANIIDADEKTRQKAFEEAKLHTLRFVYYLQTELNFTTLGVADDEFPTKDGLPFMPYFRESRRTEGVVTMNVHHILKPYEQPDPLYRTGIAVGDYPIDHHHDKYPKQENLPKLQFPSVPSFNVPLGCLIPKDIDDFIVAEKSISVTNIVNGTTRLQPVVMQIGQAAGILAALSVRDNLSPRKTSVRRVQYFLLKNKGYLMPYADIKPDNPFFGMVQRIGAVGLLKGRPEPKDWANRTWFDPDSTVTWGSFFDVFQTTTSAAAPDASVLPQMDENPNGTITIGETADLLAAYGSMVFKSKDPLMTEKEPLAKYLEVKWTQFGFNDYNPARPIKRIELAVLFDTLFDPFNKEVDFKGNFLKK